MLVWPWVGRSQVFERSTAVRQHGMPSRGFVAILDPDTAPLTTRTSGFSLMTRNAMLLKISDSTPIPTRKRGLKTVGACRHSSDGWPLLLSDCGTGTTHPNWEPR